MQDKIPILSIKLQELLRDGLDEANGGYIIVKADGEIQAYHIYNRNFFEQYLLDNTVLERTSTSKHEYMSLYEQDHDKRMSK